MVIRILGLVLALLSASCTQQVSCVPRGVLDAHAVVEECSGLGTGGPGTLVRVSRARPDSELWILEEPLATNRTGPGVGLHGKKLDDASIQARSQALVQINGFTFDCRPWNPVCVWEPITKKFPETRVFESTHQLSVNRLNPNQWGDEYLMSFGPRGSGPLSIAMSGPNGPPDYGAYNVFGSVYPLLSNGHCTGTTVDDWTVIGYSGHELFMLYAPQSDPQVLCGFLQGLGVNDAVRMDGGESAGLCVTPPNGATHCFGHQSRYIPYRIGLVTLDPLNSPRVANGGFESPVLAKKVGLHSYAGGQMAEVQWEGAMFLFNVPLYNAFLRRTGEQDVPELPSPSDGSQLVAIRPRGLATNFLAQNVSVPGNRYCMLHFFHGYNKPQGCHPSQSRLMVRADDCAGRVLEELEYQSAPTTGPGASLREEWVRLLTSNSGCMRLTFTASDVTAQGSCEVLLDNVNVSCAR